MVQFRKLRCFVVNLNIVGFTHFCANFLGENMRLCYFLRFFQVWIMLLLIMIWPTWVKVRHNLFPPSPSWTLSPQYQASPPGVQKSFGLQIFPTLKILSLGKITLSCLQGKACDLEMSCMVPGRTRDTGHRSSGNWQKRLLKITWQKLCMVLPWHIFCICMLTIRNLKWKLQANEHCHRHLGLAPAGAQDWGSSQGLAGPLRYMAGLEAGWGQGSRVLIRGTDRTHIHIDCIIKSLKYVGLLGHQLVGGKCKFF